MEKKTRIERELDKGKNVFVIKGVASILLALAPIIYIFIRYECYKFVMKISMSGWGLIAIILGVIVFYVVMKNILSGTKWAYWKQVVQGICKIFVPALALFGIVYCSIDYLKELTILITLIGFCWTLAYILNPLPELKYKEGLNESVDTVQYAMNKLRIKK